jgi:hypothetical protein
MPLNASFRDKVGVSNQPAFTYRSEATSVGDGRIRVRGRANHRPVSSRIYSGPEHDLPYPSVTRYFGLILPLGDQRISFDGTKPSD